MTEALSVICYLQKKELQRGICTLQGGTGEGAWGMWALAKLSSTDYKQVGEEVVKMSLAT